MIITGEGSLLAEYDMVEVEMSLSVEVHDAHQIMGRDTIPVDTEDSATLAYSGVAQLTDDLIDALEDEAMVPPENITTSSVEVWPIEEYYDGSYVDMGYGASTDIVLNVVASTCSTCRNESSDLSISQIYSVASSLEDANHEVRIYGFYPYVSSELKKHYDLQLFALALEDANAKAEMLAQEAGMKLGSILKMSDRGISVHSVDEWASDYYPDYYYYSDYYYSSSPTIHYSLGSGEELTQKIYVEYELLEAENTTHSND